MTEWDYIFERDWNKYSINAILERKNKPWGGNDD